LLGRRAFQLVLSLISYLFSLLSSSTPTPRFILLRFRCSHSGSFLAELYRLAARHISTMCRVTTSEKNLYVLLGVSPFADSRKIRTAYRRAALCTHPDKGGDREAFHSIVIAFEVLSCPTRRKLYDSGLSHQRVAPFKTDSKKCSAAGHPANLKFGSLGVQFRMAAAKQRRSSSWSSLGSKRTHANQGCAKPAAKRPRLSTTSGDDALQTSALRKQAALTNLRDVLKAMTSQSRSVALVQLPKQVKSALLHVMEKAHPHEIVVPKRPEQKSLLQQPARVQRHRSHQLPTSGFTGVRALAASQYKAYVDIKALRMYTRATSTIEDSVDLQIVLVQIRHALRAAAAVDSNAWYQPEKLYIICKRVLLSNDTSETQLGLSAIVSLRANQWLGRQCHITSPVLSLAAAFEVQSRLLSARQSSWDALRSEWIALTLQKMRFSRQRLPASVAENVVDAARQKALQGKLAMTIRSAAHALHREEQVKQRALKKKAQAEAHERRELVRQAALVANATREKLKLRAARLRWLRRKDLTTEELLRGLPPHLLCAGD